MRVVVAWCPDWPVTAAGFTPDVPVAVLASGRVIATSAAARQGGVQVGSRRREAERRSPGLTVLPRDPAGEARAFEPVVMAIANITPRIEVTRPGVISFGSRGPARYFGGEEALCRRVAETASEAMPIANAPAPSIGIADGRFAATLAARRGVVVPPGENRPFLAPFPAGLLPVDLDHRPELVDLLARLGIHTLGAFADLPAASVLARFGAEAARAHRLAGGYDDQILHPNPPAEPLAASIEIDPPAERAETVAFLARDLAAALAGRLARAGLGLDCLRIEAETEHGEVLSRLWRGDGGLDTAAMVERLRWQLDGWLSGTTSAPAPTAGIARLALVADEVSPVGSQAPELWGSSDADRRAGRTLDRLRGLLGPDAVFTGAIVGGRGPADRVVLVPWGEARPGNAPPCPWPGRHPTPSPSLVHPLPLPVEMTDQAQCPVTVSARGVLSAPPTHFSPADRPSVRVVAWAGPWTLDERWWDPTERRRLARFQLLGDDGRAHLFAVEHGAWRIEATYD